MLKYILAVAVALGGVGFIAQEAAAKEVPIKQNCKQQCLQSACAAVGGNFAGHANGHYCENPAKSTSVVCKKDGTCVGYVPRQTPIGSRGGSLNNILNEADSESVTAEAKMVWYVITHHPIKIG